MKNFVKTLLVLAVSVSVLAFGGVLAMASDTEYNVMIDGENVNFTDAVPVNVEGRIMVPFRAMLESLGAKVDYVEDTKTVNAITGDTTISFQIGKPEIKINKNGTETTKKMDVVPYIEAATSRTFVSTRFMAESLGYVVGWDSEEKTAVIIDYDTLFANADKDFSIMDKYMTESQSKPGVTYESFATMSASMTLYKELIASLNGQSADDVKIAVDMDASVISLDKEMSMNATMKMDLGSILAALPTEGEGAMTQVEIDTMKSLLSNITMKMYCNIDTGDCYFQTNLNSLIDPEATDATWFKMNLYKIFDEFGLGQLDLKGLIESSYDGTMTTMGDVFDMIGEETASVMTTGTYDEMVEAYNLLKNMLGDSAFYKTTKGSTTIYTADFANTLNKLLASDSELADALKISEGALVLEENGGVYKTSAKIAIDIAGLMSINLDADTSYNITTKPVEKVPAGAPIIEMDYSAL